jgi:ribosomal protein L11 methyltransferase
MSVDAADGWAETADETPVFGEPGATVSPWLATRLTALFPEGAEAAAVVRRALEVGGLETDVELNAGHVDDTDWVRLTQDQFRPIRISDRLWVVPTWHEAPEPTALNIALDPGIAFGTGSHPTTRLCLEWLANAIRGGERVLDYGCGSGILAIATMKLGAAAAVGVDIDPQAVLAAARNAEQNHVAAQFFDPPSEPAGVYDIVVANILSNPLKALAPLLASRVGPGGCLILSGILEPQAEGVVASYASELSLAPAAVLDGWVLLAGTRP